MLMTTVAWGTVPAPARADDGGSLLVVLDSSGSMKEPTGDGGSRMAAAKTALTSMLDAMDDDQAVGLRVYGATVFDSSAGESCADSQLLVPVGIGNRGALRSAVTGLRPHGDTPISHALEQAGKDLATAAGRRFIVLISDGEETCGRNPCEVAASLVQRGIDLRIDVVGLGVEGAARHQLQCIAKVGRGTYTDASDHDELTQTLDRARRRAAEPFEVSGTPIAGGETIASAPTLTAGTWTDNLPRPGETKYYALSRTMPRSTFWVGATAWPQLPRRTVLATAGLQIRPVDDEWGTCGSSVLSSWTLGDRQSTLMWGGVSSAGDLQTKELCRTGPLVVEVSASDDIPLDGTPMQLTVIEEPPVSDHALPAAAPAGPVAWTPMRHAKATQVSAATSLAEAPRIEPGTRTFDIAPGEARLVRVPVAWGQRLQALVTSGRLSEQDRLSTADELRLTVVAPMGADAGAELGPSPGSVSGKSRLGGHTLTAATHEVRYLNRHASEESIAATGMPGDYLVMVSLDRSSGSPQIALPITLTVATFGTAGTGAPTYESASTPAPSEASTPTKTSTPRTPGASESATPSGSDDRDSDSGRAGPGVALVATTVALVGLVGGGVWALGARRRRGGHDPRPE